MIIYLVHAFTADHDPITKMATFTSPPRPGEDVSLDDGMRYEVVLVEGSEVYAGKAH